MTEREPDRRQAYALVALAELRALEARLEDLRRLLRVMARAERVAPAEVEALSAACTDTAGAYERLERTADEAWHAAHLEVGEEEEA